MKPTFSSTSLLLGILIGIITTFVLQVAKADFDQSRQQDQDTNQDEHLPASV